MEQGLSPLGSTLLRTPNPTSPAAGGRTQKVTIGWKNTKKSINKNRYECTCTDLRSRRPPACSLPRPEPLNTAVTAQPQRVQPQSRLHAHTQLSPRRPGMALTLAPSPQPSMLAAAHQPSRTPRLLRSPPQHHTLRLPCLSHPACTPICCHLFCGLPKHEAQQCILQSCRHHPLIAAAPLLFRLQNPAGGRCTFPPTPRPWGRTGARSRTRGCWCRHCTPQGCTALAGSGCWGLGQCERGGGGCAGGRVGRCWRRPSDRLGTDDGA